MTLESDPLLERALSSGRMTPEQAEECRRVFRAMEGMGIVPTPIGEIAVEKGFISAEDLKAIRAMPPPPVKEPEIPGYTIHGILQKDERTRTYQAFREASGKKCAIRVLVDASRSEEVEAFEEEGRRLLRVSHPNLVSGIEQGCADGTHFVALEMGHGEILSKVIQGKGKLSEEVATGIVKDVSEALVAIHDAGLVHGDVHPKQIVIPRSGPARLLSLRTPSSPPGVETISPEMVLGEDAPGPGADLYSLGATWHWMLEGHPPFEAPSDKEVMAKHLVEPAPRAGGEREGMIARLLEKEVGKRYGSAREVIEDLPWVKPVAPVAPVAPVVAPRPRLVASGTVSRGTPPWIWPVVVASGVVVLVIILAVTSRPDGGGRYRERDPFGSPVISGERPPEEVAVETGPAPSLPVVPRVEEDEEDIREPIEEAPPAEEVAPKAEVIEPPARIAMARRLFVEELLSLLVGYRFDEAARLCEERETVLAEAAMDGLGVIQGVLHAARDGIDGWAGERRKIHLRDGQVLEGTVEKDPDGLLGIRQEEGQVAIPIRLLAAGDLLELAGVTDPMTVGLVHLLLYRNVEEASGAFGKAPEEAARPFLLLIDVLQFQVLLEKAAVAYGRKDWGRALHRYLDLLERFPDVESHGADVSRIRSRIRNALLLSGIAGSFHVDVDVVGGDLSCVYTFEDDRELLDWEGGASWVDEEGDQAAWKGSVSGDFVLEGVVVEGGPFWVMIQAYRLSVGEGGWVLQKIRGGKVEEMGSAGGVTPGRRRVFRLERRGDAIRVYLDGKPAPVMEGSDGDHPEGRIRVGGEAGRVGEIRITARLGLP